MADYAPAKWPAQRSLLGRSGALLLLMPRRWNNPATCC
jgi:hypothetical protein